MAAADELFATFEFTAGANPPSDFYVVSLRGRERLSKPFAFDLVVATSATSATPEALLGRMARLSMRGVDEPRYVQGLVIRVASEAARGADQFLRIRLVPRLSLLAKRKTSRVFQAMTTQDIVTEVLQEIGAELEWRTTSTLGTRDYCVQYQETDLEFVTRLLAEEGIFYWFKHPKPARDDASPARTDREVIVFADAPSQYDRIPGNAELPCRSGGALDGGEFIRTFSLSHAVRESTAVVRGYDYERPAFQPEGRSKAQVPGFEPAPLAVYDHDRVLEDTSVSDPVAKLRVEELRSKAVVGSGVTVSRRMIPGAMLTVTEHPIEEVNASYVVTEVEHEGRQPYETQGLNVDGGEIYVARFKAAPADVPVRPRRRARRLLQVTETATVVGPDGEEIYTDELGRVKVQFHWDRKGTYDDKSSCWIRCVEPWAGRAWGTQFIPRVGMEVAVAFTGGDTDRPMILGAVYNGVNPTPYTLPGSKTQSGIKTRSTPGGAGSNEIRFEDAADKEQLFFHAQRDMDEIVEKDHTRHVKGREVVHVDEGRILEVVQDNVRVVHGNEIVVVEQNLIMHVVGNHLMQVGIPNTGKVDEETSGPLPPALVEKLSSVAGDALLDDPQTAVVGLQRKAKMWWLAEQLDGDDYRAAKFLVGRADDLAAETAELSDGVSALTKSIDGLRERVAKEPEAVADALAALRPKIDELDKRAEAVVDRARKNIRQNVETVPAIAAVQKLAVVRLEDTHVAANEARGRLARARSLVEDFGAVRTGKATGGGGMTDTFKPASVHFDQFDPTAKSKTDQAKDVDGTKLDIKGAGLIQATSGFKIVSGGSSIEITPSGITITSSGPVAVNGNPINLNC